ncbi:MAG: bifunctional diaminohydroxyphosphoribosylaminopyrimidine deaminase/5-amino-6-(5-phosphoribosylamino)uracil reductase RibD [Proteobacteria bacterium]|nr:bifunctional diaminohydroxyphosphoribosylaminopyrimidine deaminase/5-amino-6-(5-phosphoribosylamino)uracil reductase RibD [Pseudomonadota bacterium]
MRRALALAEDSLGRCWPNPAVGCLLVKDSEIVGQGATQPGGRPHAEIVALAEAGAGAKGATAYISLEPCSHEGKSGPCAKAMIEAGLAKVIYSLDDPNPEVKGQGAAMLRQAGLEVASGLLAQEARQLNEGFFLTVTEGRPRVLLKMATSLDGRIATAGGISKWLTGDEARQAAHRLRAASDAILVGVGTVLADDPSLTCRLPGLEDRSPVRVVLDSGLRTPSGSKLMTATEVPTWIVTEATGASRPLPDGVELLSVPDCRDLGNVLGLLAERGITRLMVEGGHEIHTSFLASGLVDEIAWFRSATAIGGDGLPVFGPLGVESPGQAPRFRRIAFEEFGDDTLELFRPAV